MWSTCCLGDSTNRVWTSLDRYNQIYGSSKIPTQTIAIHRIYNWPARTPSKGLTSVKHLIQASWKWKGGSRLDRTEKKNRKFIQTSSWQFVDSSLLLDKKLTDAGVEPAISWFVVKRLAIGPAGLVHSDILEGYPSWARVDVLEGI